MLGIVSLLDAQHEARVHALWDGLEARFGVNGIRITPIPHFSYHVAPAYDREAVQAALAAIALRTAPFTIRASGIGVFSGPQPVVYIPLVRTPQLAALHQIVWQEAEKYGRDPIPYYTPQRWLPHITLGHGDITAGNLPPIVGWLNERPLDWTLPVANLALIGDADVPRWRANFAAMNDWRP